MPSLTTKDLTEIEIEVLKNIPPHTFLGAVEFTYATSKAGLSWTEGKPVLASLLEKALIADLNADTLESNLGICDRTPLGDLALGVFIAIRERADGIFVVSNPPTYHEHIAGWTSGSEYLSDSYQEALLIAREEGVDGAAIVIVGQDGEITAADYVQTTQDSDGLGKAAPNVSWNWAMLRQALGIPLLA
jgi:hypothetical protein